MIRYEGAAVCPECGQPLVPVGGASDKKSNTLLYLLVLVVVLLLLGVGLMFAQLAWHIFGGAATPTPSATPVATASVTVTATATATATPTATPQTTTPTATPSPDSSSSSSSPSPSVSGSPTEGTGKSGGQIDEKTKNDVIARVNAMPEYSDSEKKKLIDRLESAKSIKLVETLYFGLGKVAVSRDLTEKFVNKVKNDEELKKLMEDPTLVFIVAGYADQVGGAAINKTVSSQRADFVAKVLSDRAGVSNEIKKVTMGGTTVLSNNDPTKNRAVEVWAALQ